MLDQEAAAGSVCDWSYQANTAEAAYDLIDRAMLEFQTHRPRSKHIQVPIAQLEGLAEPARRRSVGLAEAIGACSADLRPLAAALSAASKPLFVIGGGAAESGADLASVLEACGAACFETYAGRGIVPWDYPLNFGAALARPSSAQIVAQADCVVAIGTELAEVDLWRAHLGHRCPLYRIDIDPECLADMQRAEVAILARAEEAMASLRPLMAESPSQWQAGSVADQRELWRGEIEAERPGIIAIVEALHAVMPDEAMIYSDMTQFAYVANEIWPMTRAKHWHHPSGFGTLGYALPAAIGGAVARARWRLRGIMGFSILCKSWARPLSLANRCRLSSGTMAS